VLAMVWKSAWKQGGNPSIPGIGKIKTSVLRNIYIDQTNFVPSLDLDHIGSVLKGVSPVVGAQPTNRSQAHHPR